MARGRPVETGPQKQGIAYYRGLAVVGNPVIVSAGVLMKLSGAPERRNRTGWWSLWSIYNWINFWTDTSQAVWKMYRGTERNWSIFLRPWSPINCRGKSTAVYTGGRAANRLICCNWAVWIADGTLSVISENWELIQLNSVPVWCWQTACRKLYAVWFWALHWGWFQRENI